jgi:predicted RNase H-like nuclease (RuvC/YqgF family)
MEGTETVDLDALESEVMKLETEREDLDAQIDALIWQATERLREQLAELHRNAETAHDSAQDLEAIAD